MPAFSARSTARLLTCDERLVELFRRVVVRHDCTILCGARSEADQNAAFESGRSTKRWPESRHNCPEEGVRSLAVDVAPYPIDWNNLERFNRFAFYVFGVADSLQLPLRWGGNWDGDADLDDQTFYDLVHFEVKL
jgi:peptidoglycan L-alanyl-D-glutamate endopeptidase CwlK